MCRKFVVIVFAITLAACATSPATYSVNNSRVIQKPYDVVWENLVEFLAKNNIQIKNIAKDSGVIYAETMVFDDSVADCGKSGIFRINSRRVNFNIFVNRSGIEPNVIVNTEFSEVRQFDTAIYTVKCNSKGLIEGNILNSVSR